MWENFPAGSPTIGGSWWISYALWEVYCALTWKSVSQFFRIYERLKIKFRSKTLAWTEPNFINQTLLCSDHPTPPTTLKCVLCDPTPTNFYWRTSFSLLYVSKILLLNLPDKSETTNVLQTSVSSIGSHVAGAHPAQISTLWDGRATRHEGAPSGRAS